MRKGTLWIWLVLGAGMAGSSNETKAAQVLCFSCKDDYDYEQEQWYHVDYTWLTGNGWKGYRHGARTPLSCAQHSVYLGGGGEKPPVT